MGSPNGSGASDPLDDFWDQSDYPPDNPVPLDSRLRNMFNKQRAIDRLFLDQNKLLEFTPWDGTAPLKAIVNIDSITYDKGSWVDKCDYTIEMTANALWIANAVESYVSGLVPEESWSVDLSDEKFGSYKLTHTLSSTQKARYNELGEKIKSGWEVARDIIATKNDAGNYIYLDNIDGSGIWGGSGTTGNTVIDPENSILSLPGHKAYNNIKSVQVDKSQGKYSITQTWLLYNTSSTSGIPCLEDYNIDEKIDETGRRRVTVTGNLVGLEENTGSGINSRITNAEKYWVYLKPQLITLAGSGLNPQPLSSSVNKNKLAGTINFTQDFDDRPVIFPGAVSAKVTVNGTNPSDVFASLVVLGKADGPILQSIGTVTSKKRSITIDIVMKARAYGESSITKPNTDALVAPYRPIVSNFKESDTDSWDEFGGRYSRTVTWTWV